MSSTSTPTAPLSILFIMDSSGSMSSMGNEPLQGLNNLIKQQKETGDFRFTLVVFNEKSKTVINDMDGKDVPEFCQIVYQNIILVFQDLRFKN